MLLEMPRQPNRAGSGEEHRKRETSLVSPHIIGPGVLWLIRVLVSEGEMHFSFLRRSLSRSY